jgi:hypothetical protein
MIQEWINDLIEYTNLGLLSKEQASITLDRLFYPKEATYSKLLTKYKISSDKSLIRCFYRTATGRYWTHCHSGGNDFYLSEVDQVKFKKMVLEREEDLNCCTTSNAFDLAFSLKQNRNLIAQIILIQMELPLLTLHLNDISYPSGAWLQRFWG